MNRVQSSQDDILSFSPHGGDGAALLRYGCRTPVPPTGLRRSHKQVWISALELDHLFVIHSRCVSISLALVFLLSLRLQGGHTAIDGCPVRLACRSEEGCRAQSSLGDNSRFRDAIETHYSSSTIERVVRSRLLVERAARRLRVVVDAEAKIFVRQSIAT